jgi:hypothetical protein
MVLPSGRDWFATGTPYMAHTVQTHYQWDSTALFDYTDKLVPYHPQKGMPKNAAFHPKIETVGLQETFSLNVDFGEVL